MKPGNAVTITILARSVAGLEARADAAEDRIRNAASAVRAAEESIAEAAHVLARLLREIERAKVLRDKAATDIARLHVEVDRAAAKAMSTRKIVDWLAEDCARLTRERDALDAQKRTLRRELRFQS